MNRLKISSAKDRIFQVAGFVATMLGLIILLIFVIDIAMDGFQRLSWKFLNNTPSRFPEKAGILTAWTGSIWIMLSTAFIAVPIGVAAGIYLQEYGKKGILGNLIELNIANLAGVPSIIYGLLGLQIFNRFMGLGNSILAGALTLALLILPIIIVATREAIKAVPDSIRQASFGMGASKWQTIWHQTLPASAGGIMTGVILAVSRAVGETAPLIAVGALAYVPKVPNSLGDDFTVLPIQIFNWVSRPQHGFIINAAAAILVLLVITVLINSVAIYLRNKWQKKMQW